MNGWKARENDSSVDVIMWFYKENLYLCVFKSCIGGYTMRYHNVDSGFLYGMHGDDLEVLVREMYRIIQVV